MGNMREISIEECNAVFGGTDPDEDVGTVVTGGKKYYDNSISSFGGFGSGSFGYGGWGGLGDFTPPEGYDLAMVDTDDDGVPDSPGIVVTASITHDQIQTINQIAGWYQWGQNLAFGLVAGERLMVSGLTAAQQLAAGTAIAGTTSLPSIDEAHYQANWNYFYWVQVGANEGYNSENGMIYLP
jgi:hypothetical protein